MKAEEVVSALMAGELDAHLTDLQTIITRRKEFLGIQLAYSLKLGDRVCFNSTVKPQYLRGVDAEVVSKFGDTIEVKLLQAAGRREKGARLRTPGALVRKI